MSVEYKWRYDACGNRKGCDCCGYPGLLNDAESTMTDAGSRDLAFCEVCSNTYLSIARTYPEQCQDGRLYRSIAIIANMLLEEIRKP